MLFLIQHYFSVAPAQQCQVHIHSGHARTGKRYNNGAAEIEYCRRSVRSVGYRWKQLRGRLFVTIVTKNRQNNRKSRGGHNANGSVEPETSLPVIFLDLFLLTAGLFDAIVVVSAVGLFFRLLFRHGFCSVLVDYGNGYWCRMDGRLVVTLAVNMVTTAIECWRWRGTTERQKKTKKTKISTAYRRRECSSGRDGTLEKMAAGVGRSLSDGCDAKNSQCGQHRNRLSRSKTFHERVLFFILGFFFFFFKNVCRHHLYTYYCACVHLRTLSSSWP